LGKRGDFLFSRGREEKGKGGRSRIKRELPCNRGRPVAKKQVKSSTSISLKPNKHSDYQHRGKVATKKLHVGKITNQKNNQGGTAEMY